MILAFEIKQNKSDNLQEFFVKRHGLQLTYRSVYSHDDNLWYREIIEGRHGFTDTLDFYEKERPRIPVYRLERGINKEAEIEDNSISEMKIAGRYGRADKYQFYRSILAALGYSSELLNTIPLLSRLEYAKELLIEALIYQDTGQDVDGVWQDHELRAKRIIREQEIETEKYIGEWKEY